MKRLGSSFVTVVLLGGVLSACGGGGGSASACADFVAGKIRSIQATTPAEFGTELQRAGNEISDAKDPEECKDVENTEENRKVLVDEVKDAITDEAKAAKVDDATISQITTAFDSAVADFLKDGES